MAISILLCTQGDYILDSRSDCCYLHALIVVKLWLLIHLTCYCSLQPLSSGVGIAGTMCGCIALIAPWPFLPSTHSCSLSPAMLCYTGFISFHSKLHHTIASIGTRACAGPHSFVCLFPPFFDVARKFRHCLDCMQQATACMCPIPLVFLAVPSASPLEASPSASAGPGVVCSLGSLLHPSVSHSYLCLRGAPAPCYAGGG